MTEMSRRGAIGRATALAAAAALAGSNILAASQGRAQAKPGAKADGVKALVYDVFGTVVDWRNGVARDAARILKPLGYNLDWLAFADAWRGLYQPTMEEVRAGRAPFVPLDVMHRRMLDQIRPKFGLEKLDSKVADDLNLAWHRLDVWPDVPAGYARLHTKFILAPCSNGNIALMVDIKRRNNLPWDAILGSEIARDFKPKPQVYLMTAAALNLQPHEVMMVAAHSDDLRSAASNGLRTAHIARPQEIPGVSENGPKTPVDFAARSMIDLADQLGV
ncbi:MAG TPA: haloacid dehalogenase type II [Micropepsaceae bacterium]|jgi:2-haloacid dehalogenase|nr:haloacid dehalogenase type II [Micropepsaceae bacterium]